MNLSRRRLGIVRTFFGMKSANLMVIAILFCSHEYAVAVSPIKPTECAETVMSAAGKAEINFEVEAERCHYQFKFPRSAVLNSPLWKTKRLAVRTATGDRVQGQQGRDDLV